MERVYIYVVDLCVSCEIYVHGSSSEAVTQQNKANPATDEVRMESQNHGLAWLERVITKQSQLKSYYQSIIA